MNAERIFGFAAAAVVAAALVAAFLFIGTPGSARLAALDERRGEDLQNIAVQLNNRYGYEGASLPARLPQDLAKNDPATAQPYEFHRLDANVYELCAVFASRSPHDDANEGTEIAPFGSRWHHGAGRTCYRVNDRTREVDPIRAR
ncbi:MAG TPA: hypothetical protein VJP85_11195 [Candidatus Baltobacteraceae bacterium]|nr:hypothetical protein [Candidatus Baltobacteraceae bacterium]